MPALSVGALPAIEEQAGRHASGTASIADEIANVDRARLALREGRSQDAWNELELYRARWPEGALAIEVAVLRIETKLALGNRLGARQEARAFLAKQPSGRYAARLRALFEAWELQ